MNVAVNTSNNVQNTAPSAGVSRTDINLPNARENGLMGPKGEGASVEVSISPKARAMLTIDMDSLAAKGYSHVGIDTDGKPGAEITIDVKPGAGVVTVSPDATGTQLEQTVPQQDIVDIILELLSQKDETSETDASKTFDPLAIFSDVDAEEDPSSNALTTAGSVIPDVAILLRRYSDAAA